MHRCSLKIALQLMGCFAFLSLLCVDFHVHLSYNAMNFQIPKRPRPLPPTAYLIGCKENAWESYVLKELHFLFHRLMEHYGWSEPSVEVIQQILPQTVTANTSIPRHLLPSYILFCEGGAAVLNALNAKLLRQHNPHIKVGYWCDDFYHNCKHRRAKMVEIITQVDVFISTYAYHIFNYYHALWSDANMTTLPDFLWIPHSASAEYTVQPFNENAKRQLIMPGATFAKHYPLRHWLKLNAAKVGNVAILPHPGYRNKHAKNHSVDFAHKLWSHTACFTCTSMHLYLVAKLFEIPAVGCLLLVNSDADDLMAALDLHPGRHYVSYDPMNPLPTIRWALDPRNQQEVNQIRRTGMQAVRELHRTSQRSDAIQAYFERGQHTYKIPKRFKMTTCPNVMHPSLQMCHARFRRLATYHGK